MDNLSRNLLAAVAMLLAVTLQPLTSEAQGTAFLYQGQLSTNGTPANGYYDMAFTIYASSTGDDPIARPVTNSATAVSNGLFIVTLDFGPGVFTGSNYWLDVSVRTAGGGVFTELSPRQPILPTPYAIYSANAGNATTANMAVTAGNASSISATNIVGTLPLAQLPSVVLTNNENGVMLNGNFTGAFSGNGAGLTNLSGVTNLVSVSGSNLCVMDSNNGGAAAWSSATDTWYPVSLAPGSGAVAAESEGNFVVMASNTGGAAAWSSATKTWYPVTLAAATGAVVAGSQGNFVVMDSNNGEAAAWSSATKSWYTVSLAAGTGAVVAGSEGNFVVMDSNNAEAAAWSSATHTWTQVSLAAGLGAAVASAQGNFVVMDSNNGEAAAWSSATGTWKQVTLSAGTGSLVIGASGN